MKRYVRFLLVVTSTACALFSSAAAQDEPDTAPTTLRERPVRGIVWERPDVLIHAEEDLNEMSRIGVEAVRTVAPLDEDLLTLADTLGLRLYLELPISHLPALRLHDTLSFASAILDTVLGLAQRHPSVRDVGLARYLDSTDSTACAFVQELAARVRRDGPPGMRVYYVTQFVESDRCAEAVDFVLTDVRDMDDPVQPLRRWNSAVERSTPLGVAAVGTWVRDDTLSGLRIPSSPEAQARYFERHLPVLLADSLSVSPPAVFVFRWRDAQLISPNTAQDLRSAYVERYGLHTRTNVRRPAYNVVKGVFTGSRDTFAFSGGRRSPAGAPWTTLFGWGVIILLGAFYALSPRFRHMVPRYFTAHFFYRDAVREGRDVLFSASTVLLICLGAAFGITLGVILEYFRASAPFGIAVSWLPADVQDVVVTLLAQPWVLVVLAGCTYAVAIIIWAITLSLISRRRFPIAPGQALMLIVWPRWPLLIVMTAAIVFASSDTPSSNAAILIAAGWIVLSAAATVRAVADFILVTRVPPALAVPALALYPGIAVAVAASLLLLQYAPELRYLWHLATRT